jgi:uncharacterized membrane protein
MGMLISGVLLWSVAHLFKSLAPEVRAGLESRLGAAARGLVAVCILAGLGLIIAGWRSILPMPVFDPPIWGRHANMLLMLLSIILFGAAQGASRIRQWVRHPMLTGMLLWAVGHLLANGEDRSIVLFGGLGLWALVSIIAISARDGAWVKPAKVASIGREAISLIIALIIYALLLWGHVYFAGVPLIPVG